jgi:hypothetical protein
VDLDGTLARSVWFPGRPSQVIGDPIWSNVAKLAVPASAGHPIIVHTSRGYSDYPMIEQWLRHWGIQCDRIVCGKVLAALYVDDRGRHESADSWLPGDVQDPRTASDTPHHVSR